MKRCILILVVAGAMGGIAALAPQNRAHLLILDWAAKAPGETPPLAVLIEMGLKDDKATDWSGDATVTGAKVAHREGYRFRTKEGDQLVEPNGWKVSSHRGLRVPPRQPAVNKLEPIATVGVVLHLSDVRANASLTVTPKSATMEKATVPLSDVLSGKAHHLWGGRAAVRLISTATAVTSGKTEDDFPAAAYGPDGTLWVAYISYTVRDESRRIEQEQLKKQPADFKALYTPEFGDQLFVKNYRDGKWSEPIAVTGPKEDLVRCAVGAEGNGEVWVVYSANRDGKHALFARSLELTAPGARLTPEQRLPTGAGRHLSPVMCTTQAGQIRVAYQSWLQDEEIAAIAVLSCNSGNWKSGLDEEGIKSNAWLFTVASAGNATRKEDGNSWYPAIAAGPSRQWTVAHDGDRLGNYDVALHTVRPGMTGGDPQVAVSTLFQARPSVAYDLLGRIWIAYEEGPEKWGKDYGAFVPDKGNPLYNARSVRVVCLDNGKLYKPVAELPSVELKAPVLPFEAPKTQRYEQATRYAYPKIGIDGKGSVWLTYRQKFGSRYTSHPGSYWLTFARRLDGDKWSEPIEVHHSDGLLDSRPVMLPHKSGGLLIIHNTDGRYTTPETVQNQIYMSYVNLPGDPVEPKLVPHDPGKKDPQLVKQAGEEREAVKRIRGYRVEVGGKKYQLLRGEFHRHTEISWDGGPDGSLEDMFRYAIDAAEMDWIGNGDHDSGAGREYAWWLIQKFTDAHHVKGKFTPMFTYERSVNYPHGHRNCMFAKRGVRTLPRLAAEEGQAIGGVHADDTKMLYRYLKELDGICAVHTSATSMGTDWRDNDPLVEPVVEIYQGDRMSYEYQGAPRAGYDPKSGKEPANVAGWFPAGFIDNAFQKGHRLGFQSSSDHWSTHISYCIVLAERHDREAILDGVKKRHCYGATDDIIVDLRSGDHLMGDEFKTNAAPALQFTVIGTKPLERIDVLKDSQVVETLKPGKHEYKGSWTDPAPATGTHYYYIRVQQSDDQLAWASPLWINYAKE
jgi:hypothetical protein